MLDRGATTFWEDFDLEWLDGSGRIDELPKEGQNIVVGSIIQAIKQTFHIMRFSLSVKWE